MSAPAAVIVLGRRGLARDVVRTLLASRSRDVLDLAALTDDPSSPVVVVLVDPTDDDWCAAERTAGGIVLIAHRQAEPDELLDLLARGADAVLDTDASFDDVLHALDTVAAGDALLSPPQARLVLDRLRGRGVREEPPRLTGREVDILASIERGESVKQTARALQISEKTVQNMQSRLFRKLGARNRAQAVTRAHELGLLHDAGPGR